ncbi:MAG: hypothetical protein EOP51_35040, partial [Sphingobacteriales bacterium]
MVKVKGDIVPGDYYVLVRADLRNNILETDEANNTTSSTSLVDIDVQGLPMNVLVSSVLSNNDERYYKLFIPDSLLGETAMVSLNSDSTKAVNELYISHGILPTRVQHDYAFDRPFSRSQDVVVASLDTGNYYVMAYGSLPAQKQQNITLLARKINFEVHSVQAKEGGNTGAVTVKINGAKFEEGMQAQLYDAVLGTVSTQNIYVKNSTLVYATFNLSGAAAGQYDVKLVKADNSSASLADGFRITTGSGGQATGGSSGNGFYCTIKNVGVEELLGISVDAPAQTRTRRVFPIVINYGNSGNVDIPVPT